MNENPFRPKETTNLIEKKSGFVDAGFVKTCDELIIGPQNHLHDHQRRRHHYFWILQRIFQQLELISLNISTTDVECFNLFRNT